MVSLVKSTGRVLNRAVLLAFFTGSCTVSYLQLTYLLVTILYNFFPYCCAVVHLTFGNVILYCTVLWAEPACLQCPGTRPALVILISSYLVRTGLVAAVAAAHRAGTPVAGDPLDRDSNRASDPYPDRGDEDHAVLALPGSLALGDQEDPGDPWGRDHAAAAPSDHEGRDYRLQSRRARKAPLRQGPAAEFARALVAVAVAAEAERAHAGARAVAGRQVLGPVSAGQAGPVA
jgi:hypothetical protein